ncbi:MAG TPA: hypothetical protein VGF61_02365 [Candidatus Acidoferrum sp.]|jgi:hypothetical protein
MPNVSGTLTIELALLMAIVSPCGSEGGLASLSHGRSILNNQSEFAVAGSREHPTNAPATSRPEDDAEGTEHKKPCAVENVIPGASREVREFVENVNRISATELVEHERMNKDGVVIEQKHHKFNYVAEIQETRPGILNMDEYRDGSPGQSGFPGELSTVGITSLVLIFHPYHVKEFAMTCEAVNWQGHPAWKVHFEQRPDQPARMSALRVGDASYSIFLKGIAWIDQQNYQIVHLETDILKPVPAVRLTTEHQVLDYGPIQFEQKKLRLWLPLDAEIYLDVNGKRFRHRHTYSDYRVFSVDLGLKEGDPK